MKNQSVNKILLALCLFLFQAAAFAGDYHASVTQNIQIPGGRYAADASSALIPYSVLPKGRLNLLYKFEIDTDDEESENEFIRGVIRFSKKDFRVIAFNGLQSYEFEDGHHPLIFDRCDYVEFLVPVKDAWKGAIEIQMTVSNDDVGKDLPVEVSFDGYKRPISSYVPILGKYVSTKSIQAKISDGELASGEDVMESVMTEYSPFSMSTSVRYYTIQVVE